MTTDNDPRSSRIKTYDEDSYHKTPSSKQVDGKFNISRLILLLLLPVLLLSLLWYIFSRDQIGSQDTIIKKLETKIEEQSDTIGDQETEIRDQDTTIRKQNDTIGKQRDEIERLGSVNLMLEGRVRDRDMTISDLKFSNSVLCDQSKGLDPVGIYVQCTITIRR